MNRREFVGHVATISGCALVQPQALQGQVPEGQTEGGTEATGPLRVHPENSRYFADDRGRAILLTGSHVWNNLVDMGPGNVPPSFDFDAYLDFLKRYGHNFIRLWTWEHSTWDSTANGQWGKDVPHVVAPHPWPRTGPGAALDGKPRFDVSKFDDEYFRRLRTRVEAAGEQGVYVAVMLFEGWAMQNMEGAWSSHPFHPANNVNQIDGDVNGDGQGLEVHTLANRRITERQESYVRKVVDTVGDLDNVLYEISNENHPASTQWQYHMIDFVHAYEREKPAQHPVGMTFQYKGGSNQALWDSPADWISPNAEGGYRDDPPPADGRKVILNDTDHLWGIGGNGSWVWKSFVRGHNPIFMDPYDGIVLGERFAPEWEPIRRNMGHARRWAERMNLAACVPRGDLASTQYCLADVGREYLVYVPDNGEVRLDVSGAKGAIEAEWIDAATGESRRGETLAAGEHLLLPGLGRESLLYVRRHEIR